MNIFDTTTIIKVTGYVGLFSIIFAETSILLGIFLPGDSLLFTAGFLASTGYLNIALVITVTFAAAVIGNGGGYVLGRKYGHKIFKHEDSLLFHKDHIKLAKKFYMLHGGKTVVIARFLPIVRTVAPVLAGIGKMRRLLFMEYSVLGAALWTVGLGLFGYYFGKTIHNPDRYVLPIVLGIIALSVLPAVIAVLHSQENRKHIYEKMRKLLNKINVSS